MLGVFEEGIPVSFEWQNSADNETESNLLLLFLFWKAALHLLSVVLVLGPVHVLLMCMAVYITDLKW